MAKTKRDITRVNVNLPSDTVARVRDYANSLGLPITQTYVVLINMGLEQSELMKQLPSVIQTLGTFNENFETALDRNLLDKK